MIALKPQGEEHVGGTMKRRDFLRASVGIGLLGPLAMGKSVVQDFPGAGSASASVSSTPETTYRAIRSYDGSPLQVAEKKSSERSRQARDVVVCFPPCIYTHHFFDCPVDDYSLMGYLSSQGFHVFAYDPRGFGQSYRPEDGRSIDYELELRDAAALVDHVFERTGAETVSFLGFGSGAQVACGHALRHPGQVKSLVLMDFVWKVFPEPLPPGFKEMLESQPRGYLDLSQVSGFFGPLLRFASPEIQTWVMDTFREAAVGPFLTAFAPMPLITPAERITSSIMVIRGTEAGITSEADTMDFLEATSGSVLTLYRIQGGGPVPSLEREHYRAVQEQISWFLG